MWRDLAVRSAQAVVALEKKGLAMRDILTPRSIRNAMVVHAAFGGSTNLLLHVPAIAHSGCQLAKVTRPSAIQPRPPVRPSVQAPIIESDSTAPLNAISMPPITIAPKR